MPNLVVIKGDIYSFFEEYDHVITVQSQNMQADDIEFYRQNLDILVAEATQAQEYQAEQLELEF